MIEVAETEPLLRPDFWVTPHPYMKARQHRHSLPLVRKGEEPLYWDLQEFPICK